MNTGNFYFIKDEYYKRFPNCGLMGNKDSDEAGVHGRPCFYCFEMDGYFWMVPISSKTEKYKAMQAEKEVQDLHQRTKEGIETARLNGKQIGLPKGTKLTTRKSVEAKEKLLKYSRDFNGTMNDEKTMIQVGSKPK